MKRTFLLILSVALVVGVIGSSLSRKLTVQAQANQRLLTESLGVTRGQYLVADLASFPDGATKLVLRDPNGRVGIVLAVSDRAGAERAQIEFYDAGGQLIRTLNASSSGDLLEARMKRLEDRSLESRVKRLEGISLPAVSGPGRSAQSNTENLWIRLDGLDKRVRDLERKGNN